MENRDMQGRFTKGYKNNLLRDGHGRFIKKNKEKTTDRKPRISTVENHVDELLEKAGL